MGMGIKAISNRNGREYYWLKYTDFKNNYLNKWFEAEADDDAYGTDYRIHRALERHKSLNQMDRTQFTVESASDGSDTKSTDWEIKPETPKFCRKETQKMRKFVESFVAQRREMDTALKIEEPQYRSAEPFSPKTSGRQRLSVSVNIPTPGSDEPVTSAIPIDSVVP